MPVANFCFYTIEDLRILQQAIVSGELKSKHQDRLVVYRDLDEMLRIEQRTIKALNENNGKGKRERNSFRLCVDQGL